MSKMEFAPLNRNNAPLVRATARRSRAGAYHMNNSAVAQIPSWDACRSGAPRKHDRSRASPEGTVAGSNPVGAATT